MWEAACGEKKQKFTALLHHVTIDLLGDSYASLKKKAEPGVDRVTWPQYWEGLEEDLHDRIHRCAYRALPSRRTYMGADAEIRAGTTPRRKRD